MVLMFLSPELKGFLKISQKGVISPQDLNLQMNTLLDDILTQVIEFDEKQSQSKTANITNQKTQVDSIALPAKNYWQVIEDEFIHNLEKYLYMNPQSRSTNSETGVQIFTYYFLEEQLEKYKNFITELDSLSYFQHNYSRALIKIVKSINEESLKLGTLLDDSDNTPTEIRWELKNTYECSQKIKNHLIEAIQHTQPRVVLEKVDKIDKNLLILSLKRLEKLLEEKKEIASGFSIN